MFFMAKKSKKDYFGLDWIISLILAIIPITSWVLGFLTRFKEGKYVAGVVRVLLGFNIVWILDLVFMIWKHSICRLLDM